jgi:hypothetical protein
MTTIFAGDKHRYERKYRHARVVCNCKYRVVKNVNIVAGLHYTNFLLNNSQALEPGHAIKWDITQKAA